MASTYTVKAIETIYKGYRFRSRLEARWAVFFDALGIEWEYEAEGYDLGPLGYYLPDFYLPQIGCFGEVKPGRFSREEWAKCVALPKPCILFDGPPKEKIYYGTAPQAWNDSDDQGLPVDGYDYYCSYAGNLDNLESSVNKGRGRYVVGKDNYNREKTRAAIAAARQARFEHGQVGAPTDWR